MRNTPVRLAPNQNTGPSAQGQGNMQPIQPMQPMQPMQPIQPMQPMQPNQPIQTIQVSQSLFSQEIIRVLQRKIITWKAYYLHEGNNKHAF